MASVDSSGFATVGFRAVNPISGVASQPSIGLIDSGDQRAVVSPALISSIGAMPYGTSQIIGFDGQPVGANLYMVDLDFGSGGYVPSVIVASYSISGLGFDALIGVNILRTGVFTYNGPKGTFTFDVGRTNAPAITSPTTYAAVGLIALGLAGIGIALLGKQGMKGGNMAIREGIGD